jgi:hypothetical protein
VQISLRLNERFVTAFRRMPCSSFGNKVFLD